MILCLICMRLFTGYFDVTLYADADIDEERISYRVSVGVDRHDPPGTSGCPMILTNPWPCELRLPTAMGVQAKLKPSEGGIKTLARLVELRRYAPLEFEASAASENEKAPRKEGLFCFWRARRDSNSRPPGS